jgi:copper homeostasis protein
MKLEICVDRLESARAVFSGGADRIEVCGALSLGGITASHAFIERCVAMGGGRAMAMIRPHAGGFCYCADDIQTMVQDIQIAKQLGVEGVVLGVLNVDGSIDREACQRLIDAARPLSITFHRAFDLTPDPFAALDTLLELGVDRLLTSGQAASALQGANLIRELVQRSGKHLTVVAGAGIQAQQIESLLRTTGVTEIHASASALASEAASRLPGIVSSTRVTQAELVRELVMAIRRYESDGASLQPGSSL